MMKLTEYDKHKNSGIEWLGEVPEHWEVKRVKDLSHMKSGDFISAEQIDNDGKYPVFGGGGLRGFTDNFNREGHFILMGRQGANCGNIKYGRNKFWATEHAVVTTPINGTNIVWFGELLRAMNLNQYSLTAAQPGLSVDVVKRLKISVPSKSEQTQIANYLGQATTRIDKKIDILTQKIKHYQDLKTALINRAVTKGLDNSVEMKDSKIKWLGKVPCHWKEIRFKQVFKKKSKRKNLTLNCGSISFGEVVFKDNDSIPTERRETYQEVLKGEFLINPLNLNFDLKSLRTALSAKDVIVSSGYIVLQSNKSYDKDYLRWLLHEFDVSTMKNLGAGIRQTLRFDDVGSSVFCTPPINEQKQIGDYLNQKISIIYKIIETIITQIEYQKELRKTLINDVVTGKVKVENN